MPLRESEAGQPLSDWRAFFLSAAAARSDAVVILGNIVGQASAMRWAGDRPFNNGGISGMAWYLRWQNLSLYVE